MRILLRALLAGATLSAAGADGPIRWVESISLPYAPTSSVPSDAGAPPIFGKAYTKVFLFDPDDRALLPLSSKYIGFSGGRVFLRSSSDSYRWFALADPGTIRSFDLAGNSSSLSPTVVGSHLLASHSKRGLRFYDIYDAVSGELIRSIPIPRGASQFALFADQFIHQARKDSTQLTLYELPSMRRRGIRGPADRDLMLAWIGPQHTIFAKAGELLLHHRESDTWKGPFRHSWVEAPEDQGFDTILEGDGHLIFETGNNELLHLNLNQPAPRLYPIRIRGESPSDKLLAIRDDHLWTLDHQSGDQVDLKRLDLLQLPEIFVSTQPASERDSSLRVEVSLDRSNDQPVEIDFRTSDASARAGEDYSATAGTLIFAPGETSKTLEIPLIADRTVERDELFQIHFDRWSGAYLNAPPPVAKIWGSGSRLAGNEIADISPSEIHPAGERLWARSGDQLEVIHPAGDPAPPISVEGLDQLTPMGPWLAFVSEGKVGFLDPENGRRTMLGSSSVSPQLRAAGPDYVADLMRLPYAADASTDRVTIHFPERSLEPVELSSLPLPEGGILSFFDLAVGNELFVIAGKCSMAPYDYWISAHEVETGRLLWQRKTELRDLHRSSDNKSLRIVNDRVACLTDDHIELLDGATGEVLASLDAAWDDRFLAAHEDLLFVRRGLGVSVLDTSQPLAFLTTLPRIRHVIPFGGSVAIVDEDSNASILRLFDGSPSVSIANDSIHETDGLLTLRLLLSEAAPRDLPLAVRMLGDGEEDLIPLSRDPILVPAEATEINFPVRAVQDLRVEFNEILALELQLGDAPPSIAFITCIDDEISTAVATPLVGGDRWSQAAHSFGNDLSVHGETALVGWKVAYEHEESKEWPLIEPGQAVRWLPRPGTFRGPSRISPHAVHLGAGRAYIAINNHSTPHLSGVEIHDLDNPNGRKRLIRPPRGTSNYRFGRALLEIPGFLVVGAANLSPTGKVFLYDLRSFALKRTLGGTEDFDRSFGQSLAFDGTTLWVGSPNASIVDGFDPVTGAKVATLSSDTWYFGRALAGCDGALLVGSKGQADLFLGGTDPVETYRSMLATGSSSNFGASVALSSTHVLIADPTVLPSAFRPQPKAGKKQPRPTWKTGSTVILPDAPKGSGFAQLHPRNGGNPVVLRPSAQSRANQFGTALALTPTRALVTGVSADLNAPVLEAFPLSETISSGAASQETIHETIATTRLPAPELLKSSKPESPFTFSIRHDLLASLPDGITWAVQVSSDLSNWRDVVVGSGGSHWVLDPAYQPSFGDGQIQIEAPAGHREFFRVLLRPG